MQQRRVSLALALLVLLSIVGANIALAAPAAQPAPPPGLYLKAGAFTPAAGQQPTAPPGLAVASQQAGGHGYYIVQYGGPILQEWRDGLSGQQHVV